MAPFGADGSSQRAFARRMGVGGTGIAEVLALVGSTEVINLGGGFPAPETFPAGEVKSMLTWAGEAAALQYAPVAGLPGLRSAIAERLERDEGRHPASNELLVTSGGIDAMALVGRCLLDQGDLVAVEGPTYLGAISSFRGYEAELREVPADTDGLNVEAFVDMLRSGARPKLLYVIPDHQNPAGVTLCLERRTALVELCRRWGVLIVEDVAYRDLGFEASRLPSLWSLAPDATVQIGTFSKILFPGVRLGWAVGPDAVISKMVLAKQISDQCAGSLGQCLAEQYLRSGAIDVQLPRSRALYKERRDTMLQALEVSMPRGIEWTRPCGGFFIWLTGSIQLNTVDLVSRAAGLGVAFVPGRHFYAEANKGINEMRLSYSAVKPADIAEGIRRLGDLLASRGEQA